ncbi:serine-aspartate repeat-containing protein I-like isoform X3 [Myxocyprinus asiaticus]|uniref:serine-aspartate repeat-containing protein I-like isoform X3 n=1 Tax=Myxocyprinus asiaticus TaxID=70543 RepID=UPI002223E115|nr:serine-aspartate repeat-containing protein I-like isoform X3 [Myxocyprinus asiaticus]
MMSYLWIFCLGSLIVTGVRMQEDAVEDAENAEAAADDLAPADGKESTVPDNANTTAEDLPQDSDDTSVSEADGEAAAADPVEPEEDVEEPVTPTIPADPDAEDTTPEPEDASDVEPTVESSEEPAAAEEEPAEEEEEEEAPAEAGENDMTVTDDAGDEEVTGDSDADAAGDADVDVAGDADADAAGDADVTVNPLVDEPEVTQTEAPEEPAQEEPSEDEADTPEGPAETDSSDVTEKPDEEIEKARRGFDLSDAFPDLAENKFGDADRHSASDSGPGKARSAGASSGPSDRGSGTVVGVVCGIAVAAIGAITGYFTYQKKKLCFKVQRGDPESAKEENDTQNDPQVLSNLLPSS